jgi:prophage regulatory protein
VTDRIRERLVRLPEVLDRTSLSAPTVYRKIAKGEFPRQRQLSANIVAWNESDLEAWIADPLNWGRKAA